MKPGSAKVLLSAPTPALAPAFVKKLTCLGTLVCFGRALRFTCSVQYEYAGLQQAVVLRTITSSVALYSCMLVCSAKCYKPHKLRHRYLSKTRMIMHTDSDNIRHRLMPFENKSSNLWSSERHTSLSVMVLPRTLRNTIEAKTFRLRTADTSFQS